ncbi:MAG: peptidylprolyl isomerase [Desulfosporosinus sp.]|nr:peptidylprolyl isomerase [Desulfosporosinus sp.]
MRNFKLGLLFLVFVLTIAASGCGSQPPNSSELQTTGKDDTQTQSSVDILTDKNDPIVTITMASGEEIKVELYPKVAPNTVNNFISLVQKGFYNGLIFHRVIPGFMIQGGDPNGNGTGNPGYSIKGEFTNNGFNNDLKHERGVISMGRTQYDLDSAGSQFFIMVETVPSLDKDYAAFGKVISGMETVDKIVNSPKNKDDKPNQDQVMKSVTVDTLGVEYAEPEVIKK